MAKTATGFIVLGAGCLLLVGVLEYLDWQDSETKALAEQNGMTLTRYKALESLFAQRADRLLESTTQEYDPQWGITRERIARQGKTFFVEVRVNDAPAFQGESGTLVKQLLPYTHPNTLALFFSEKGLCRKPVYRMINSDVTFKYIFEGQKETQSYVRTLNNLCGWTKYTLPDPEQQVIDKQMADFTLLNSHLKGVYLDNRVGKAWQTYAYTRINEDIPSVHFTASVLSDMPEKMTAKNLWRLISSPALCEQLAQFDKLPLTLYASVKAESGTPKSADTRTISALCQR